MGLEFHFLDQSFTFIEHAMVPYLRFRELGKVLKTQNNTGRVMSLMGS